MRLKLIALALLLASQAAHAADLRLRQQITVDGADITLGDLFDGLDRKAAAAFVAAAPAPGDKLYLRPLGVAQLVQNAGLSWQPEASMRGIIVSRAGKAIPREVIAESLNRALMREGAPENFELSLAALPTVYTTRDARAKVKVENVDYDPRSGRFSAMLSADGGADPVRVAGRVTATSQVPVLRNKVNPGDVITKSDIEWKEMPADRVGRNYLTEMDELIGQSPKRVLMPGQPVRVGDVQKPMTVAKNAMVTMTVSSRGMTLTALGRAIDAGATGDVIQVMNVQTKKTVQATVAGPNLVQVMLPATALPILN